MREPVRKEKAQKVPAMQAPNEYGANQWNGVFDRWPLRILEAINCHFVQPWSRFAYATNGAVRL